jgi:hypothetical protein
MGLFAKFGPVFFAGFFALAAQTLIFRDFLAVFDGNELSAGLFLFSWLTWMCAGALAARFILARLISPGWLAPLLTLFIPLFALQRHLTIAARDIAGVAPFETFPLAAAALWIFILSAPLSLFSGAVFVTACEKLKDSSKNAAGAVYAAESLGSFAGALCVVPLLARGVSVFTVYAAVSAVFAAALLLSALWEGGARRLRGGLMAAPCALALAAALGCLLSGLGPLIDRAYDRRAWGKLFPGSEFLGSFSTQSAKYLYGKNADQFLVVSGGTFCDVVPDDYTAARTAAFCLAEKPSASHLLLETSGGASLTGMPGKMRKGLKTAWFSADPEYPGALMKAAPADVLDKIKAGGSGPEVLPDIREAAGGSAHKYDLIFVGMRNPETLAQNRYFTLENFLLLKQIMTPGAVIGVAFPGGENYIGPELSCLGASLLATLRGVFQNTALRPGDDSMFFASDRPGAVSSNPEVLRGRLASIPGITDFYQPDFILSDWPADRVRFQMAAYEKTLASAGEGALVNSDSSPKTFLFSLLLAMKKSGIVSPDVKTLETVGALILPLFAALALAYPLSRAALMILRPRSSINRKLTLAADALTILFAASFAGMAVNTVLLFMWQTKFGSLFLKFGLLSSLFMLGAFAGAWLAAQHSASKGVSKKSLIAATLLTALFIFAVRRAGGAGEFVFSALFFGAGFFTGVFAPLAAELMRLSGMGAGTSGALLVLADYGAGALAGLLVPLLFLPLTGVTGALTPALIMAAAVLALSASLRIPAPRG